MIKSVSCLIISFRCFGVYNVVIHIFSPLSRFVLILTKETKRTTHRIYIKNEESKCIQYIDSLCRDAAANAHDQQFGIVKRHFERFFFTYFSLRNEVALKQNPNLF